MTLAEAMRLIEEETGAVVNLEVVHHAFLLSPVLKLGSDQYLHHGAFCRRRKTGGHIRECAGNKRRSVEIARRGRMFRGCCPFGVRDLAVPVLHQGELAAVIYLGGLPPGSGESPELWRKLREHGRFLAEFIRLELIRQGAQTPAARDDAFYLRSAEQFINRKYMEPATLEELAELLRMNPNYLGSVLRRASGRSFRELLNRRRLEEAQLRLQLHRTESIQQIAGRCGFADSNYFCVVFRKYLGMSPSEYRRRAGTPLS